MAQLAMPLAPSPRAGPAGLPALLPRSAPRSNAATQAAPRTGVRCSAEGADSTQSEGSSMGRRQTLGALAAAASAVAAAPILLEPGPAVAADIVQRGQRKLFLDKLKNTLAGAVEANQDVIPGLLRLAINDAATYDKESKTGGANGSIHFAEELGRTENAGLKPALALLEWVKAKVDEGEQSGPISYADLIVFGAAAALKRSFINSAIAKAGGDPAKGIDLYRAIGSAGNWGSFDKLFGRADAAQADPAGRVPVWADLSPAELKAKFEPYGLKPRQIVVLSVFLSDDLEALEAKLAEDPEFATWVQKYTRSRQTVSRSDYEVDLIAAFGKFATLGAPINTEAYTYIPPRPKIRF